jgi:hypothetical protein
VTICANLFEQSDDLLELCAREFERFVDELFLRCRESGLALARCPIIDRLYDVQSEADTARIKRMLHSAVRARQHFRQHGPSWAPLLPLTFDDIEQMEHDPSNRVELVGHYASSLMMQQWNLKLHPSFHDYASGVMAYKYAPEHLRNDPELMAEFSARPLAGLDKGLSWRSPEQIAELRLANAQCEQQYRDDGVPEPRLREMLDQEIADLNAIS